MLTRSAFLGALFAVSMIPFGAGCSSADAGDDGDGLSEAQQQDLTQTLGRIQDLSTYETDYTNLVVSGQASDGSPVAIVLGQHAKGFPYGSNAAWDNVLLLVGGTAYQAVGPFAKVAFDLDRSGNDAKKTSARVSFDGKVKDKTGREVSASFELVLDAARMSTKELGKRYNFLHVDAIPGMRWQPYSLRSVQSQSWINLGTRSAITALSGEVERAHLTNLKAKEFAFSYDYVALATASASSPNTGYAFVDFSAHALFPNGIIGYLVEKYAAGSASETLTLQGDRETKGNANGVTIPAKSDSRPVLIESKVDLQLATLQRQLIQTKDGSGRTVYGLREIFTAK